MQPRYGAWPVGNLAQYQLGQRRGKVPPLVDAGPRGPIRKTPHNPSQRLPPGERIPPAQCRPKPIPRRDVHFGEIDDDRKASTAPHITFRPQLGGHRWCGLAICTFHLGFSLVLQPQISSRSLLDRRRYLTIPVLGLLKLAPQPQTSETLGE